MKINFSAKLWQYQGKAAWYFVTLPIGESLDLKTIYGNGRGFGSIKVSVTIGITSWLTSIFPDTKTGCYLLPVKKAVRLAEKLEAGNNVKVELVVNELE